MLAKGFVYLEDPRIFVDLKYATPHNFTGRKIAHYFDNRCILTQAAAKALIAVQNDLENLYPHYHLKIFDAYRPMSAVLDFQSWARDDRDIKMKSEFYPDYHKPELFSLGYISNKSSHCRGSTVDLTIVQVTVKTHNSGPEDTHIQEL